MRWRMAAVTSHFSKQLLTMQNRLVRRVSTDGNSQCSRVQRHPGKYHLVHLGKPPMRFICANDLCRGAIILGDQSAGESHVTGERAGHLRIDVRLIAFPAKPSNLGSFGSVNPLDSPAYGISVDIIRIRQRL